jgi:hypothetical protein
VTDGARFTRTNGADVSNITLNLDLALVPPDGLTGALLVPLSSAVTFWSLESGQWIWRDQGRYEEPGGRISTAARYEFTLFIDDANPAEHGVRDFRVTACAECGPPADEGDSCP